MLAFPQEKISHYTTAKITPIHKKGDKNVISNYRSISLLPTLSKVFERVIHKQLHNYFNNENLLAEQPYGFRAKHSTELATIKLVDFFNHEMDIGNTPVTVFLDLSKAFDTLNFDILLSKTQILRRKWCSIRLNEKLSDRAETICDFWRNQIQLH